MYGEQQGGNSNKYGEQDYFQETSSNHSNAYFQQQPPMQPTTEPDYYANITYGQASVPILQQPQPMTVMDDSSSSAMEDTTPYGRARTQVIQSYGSFQRTLDKTIPYLGPRWVASAIIFGLFWVRILLLQGFYVVAYTASIYQLNILLLFLTPKFLPEDFPSGFGDDAASSLPTTSARGADDEFRPFIRRLPEFNFWHQFTMSASISLVATFFDALDIPVFWPILLVYFIVLFVFTMRRQIEHMVAHNYIPFDFGKKRFRGGSQGSSKF